MGKGKYNVKGRQNKEHIIDNSAKDKVSFTPFHKKYTI